MDEISGDGHKNGINYEIKTSIYSKNGRLNFIQIRPDHSIDYYIFCCYNLWEGDIGKAFILKIPSEDLHKIFPQYSGYAHGTFLRWGKITENNLKDRNCEFFCKTKPKRKKKLKIIQTVGCAPTIRSRIPFRKFLTIYRRFQISKGLQSRLSLL